MRPFEFALFAAVLIGCVRPLSPSAHRLPVSVAVAVGTLSVAGIHLVTEGARWQLAPLYLAAVVTAGASIVATAEHAGGQVRPAPHARLRWSAIAAIAAVGGATGMALPVPAFPVPSGDHAVGTMVFALTDHDRIERYGERVAGGRRLVVQLWYPADPEAAVEPSAWVPAGAAFGREAASWLGLPRFALDHVALIESDATIDAPLLPHGDLPVVVYAHGWGGFRSIQADLAESLASHGYVVAALDHTYASLATQFPGGEVVPIDPSALPSGTSQEVYDAAASRLVETFATDIAFLLDHLSGPDAAAFAERLDLDRVAVVGHSTGGGAGVLLCSHDPRCAVVVGFDPWVVPVPDAVVGAGLDVPTLSLRSQEWVGDDNDARLRRLHAASGAPAGLVAIAGTYHRDVTLLPYLSPLSSLVGLTGDTPGARTHEIIDVWTRRFLDTHLRGRAIDDPLQTPPDFAEARLDG